MLGRIISGMVLIATLAVAHNGTATPSVADGVSQSESQHDARDQTIAWIESTMRRLSPPERPHHEPAAQESRAQAEQRYHDIAEAIVDASFDPNAEPVFAGSRARQNTAMLVAVMFHFESGYRRDIDLGLSRARLARSGWNDFGRSWCMGQINLGRKQLPDPENQGQLIEESASTTQEGWSGRDLIADRRKCVTATIRILRQSIDTCRSLPSSERLAMYAAGTCGSESGKRASRVRMHRFLREVVRDVPAERDADVFTSIRAKTTATASTEVGDGD